jgi:hypothetical protein
MCECGKLHVNKRLTIEQDPTRQGANRARAERDINKRLAGAMGEIKAFLLAMPQRSETAPDGNSQLVNRQVYIYERDPYRDVKPFILAVIGRWFETGQTNKPPRWFFDAYAGPSYSAGAADTYSRLSMLAVRAGYDIGITSQLQLEQVLLSQPYQSRIEYVFQRSFNSMEKFSGDLGADLSRALADAMTSGRSPRTLADVLAKQFAIKHSRAMTIARTEINEAYRTARYEEAKDVRDRILPALKVMHRSALLPTTRTWHADRHGRVFTLEEQDEWWSDGANRINCYCTSMEVLFDKKGNMYDAGLQEKLLKQRKTYFGLAE